MQLIQGQQTGNLIHPIFSESSGIMFDRELKISISRPNGNLVSRLEHAEMESIGNEGWADISEAGHAAGWLFSLITQESKYNAASKVEDGIKKAQVPSGYTELGERITFNRIPGRMWFFVKGYIESALSGILYEKPVIVYGETDNIAALAPVNQISGKGFYVNDSQAVVVDLFGRVHALMQNEACQSYRESSDAGHVGIVLELEGRYVDALRKGRLRLDPGIYATDNPLLSQMVLDDSLDLEPCEMCSGHYVLGRIPR